MKTVTQRVSYAYGRYPDGEFLDFLDGIMLNVFGNLNFPDPPVDAETFGASIAAFREAKAAMAQGGTAATADKNNKREAVYALSKLNGAYVEGASNNNLAILLTSGYEAISTNRTREPLTTPVSLNAKFGNTGCVLLTVKAVKHAKSYESSYAMINADNTIGEWQAGPPSTSSRNINVTGLVSGQLYIFRVRAIGGSTGLSDWSDTTSHRAM